MQKKNYYTQEQFINARRQSLSYEGEQELCCIALIMSHGISFELLMPRKMKLNKERAIQSFFFTINQIIIGNDVFPFNSLIQNESVELKTDDHSSQWIPKKIIKERRRNLISMTNNFLSDLLVTIGYQIEFRNTRMTEKIVKMQRIETIRGSVGTINREEISQIGNQVNDILLERLSREGIKAGYPFRISQQEIGNIFSPSVDKSQLVLQSINWHLHLLLNKQNDEEEQQYFRSLGYDIIQSDFGWYACDQSFVH